MHSITSAPPTGRFPGPFAAPPGLEKEINMAKVAFRATGAHFPITSDRRGVASAGIDIFPAGAYTFRERGRIVTWHRWVTYVGVCSVDFSAPQRATREDVASYAATAIRIARDSGRITA
jgi:hypothetical protein